MRYIGDQRTRVTGAGGPFTPVRTRLDIELIKAGDPEWMRKRQRQDDIVYILCKACMVAIGMFALFAICYLIARSI